MKMQREFYMPKSGTLAPVDCAGTDAAVFTYESNGASYAIGFHGKVAKPDWHHRFRTVESRDKHIAEYLAGRKQYAESMAARKVERCKPHTYKVGDILDSSWGYDQTNIDFYEVVEVTERTITVRQIASKCIGGSQQSDSLMPEPGHYIGEPVLKVVNGGSIKMASWGRYASLWDGRVCHQTAAGWGH